jgi:hypothetical protein
MTILSSNAVHNVYLDSSYYLRRRNIENTSSETFFFVGILMPVVDYIIILLISGDTPKAFDAN